jgi:hypothetical protein
MPEGSTIVVGLPSTIAHQPSKKQGQSGSLETMHMIRKGQIDGVAKRDVLAQNRVINQLLGLAAERELANLSSRSNQFLQHYRSAVPKTRNQFT